MQIDQTNYESVLLSYIDGELTEAESREVEGYCAGHPEAARELVLLRQTVLVAPVIVFPEKASLYREENKRRLIGAYLWRAAVIAVIFTGAAFLYYQTRTSPGMIKENDGRPGKINGRETGSVNPDSDRATRTPSVSAKKANGVARIIARPETATEEDTGNTGSASLPAGNTAAVSSKKRIAVPGNNNEAGGRAVVKKLSPVRPIAQTTQHIAPGADGETALVANSGALREAQPSRVSMVAGLPENTVSVRVDKKPESAGAASPAIVKPADNSPAAGIAAASDNEMVAGDDAVSVIHVAKTGTVVGKLFRRLSRGRDDAGQAAENCQRVNGAEKKVNISIFQFAMSR